MHNLSDGIKLGSLFPGPVSSRKPTSFRPLPTASQIMTRRLISLDPQQTVEDAIAILARHRISGAPVLSASKQLLGIISEFDCIRLVAAGDFHQEDQIRLTSVCDAMTPALHTLGPDDDLHSVCAKFVNTRVRRLPVIDAQAVVGMLTRRDLVKTMARQWRR